MKCPWPVADSLAPHRSSIPGHPPEAVPVGAVDTGAGRVCSQPCECSFVSLSIHSCLSLSGSVLTQTESRPCLQAASDLSWDARQIQLLLEVSLSPSRQNGCLSVVFTLGPWPLLCSCLLMDRPKTVLLEERGTSHPTCVHREGSFSLSPVLWVQVWRVARSSCFVRAFWMDGWMD